MRLRPHWGNASISTTITSWGYPIRIDIVQGCTGGVSALILASQLCEWNKSNVLVVAADAAKKRLHPSARYLRYSKMGCLPAVFLIPATKKN
jgi:hypothetical protein